MRRFGQRRHRRRVLPDLPFPPGGLHRGGVLPADARHPLRRAALPMLSRRRLFARPPRVRPARTSRRGLPFRRRMYASGPYNRSRDRYPDIPYPSNPSHEIIYSAAGPAARRLYGICRLHCQKGDRSHPDRPRRRQPQRRTPPSPSPSRERRSAPRPTSRATTCWATCR